MRSGLPWRILRLLVLSMMVAIMVSIMSIGTSITLQTQATELSKSVQEFVRGPKIVLTHVRIIDGSGAPAIEDQNVILEAGKIAGVENSVRGRYGQY